jgi:hypothetical protein
MPVEGAELLWAMDEVEAAAWRDVAAAAPAALVDATGLTCARVGAVTLLVAPRIPAPLFNRAIGLGNREPATDLLLDEVIVGFAAAGVADPWIQISAAARPSTLTAWLGDRGFVPARRRAWVKVVRGREPPPAIATTFAVRELGDGDRAALARVLCAAHGIPAVMGPMISVLVGRRGWRAYGALDGDTLIAGGLMRLDDRVAWLGFGGTLPSHRGRGAQGALMARRIADAIALGASTIATETGAPEADERNPSLDNMMRCGFRAAGTRANWCLARA